MRTVALGAAWLGVSMLVLSAVPNVAVAVVVAAVVGAGSVAFMTAATAIAQLRSDQEMIGRVLAIQTVLIIGTTPIGGPILGAISDAIGARSPVLIGGVGALAAAGFGLLAARRSARPQFNHTRGDSHDRHPASEDIPEQHASEQHASDRRLPSTRATPRSCSWTTNPEF